MFWETQSLSVTKKMDFYKIFVGWIGLWCTSPSFKLTFQKKSALVLKIPAQADIFEKSIEFGCELVRTTRFQSDPIEKRFSQHRKISDRRFLVRLREVLNSERILNCWSLIKENINFWEENIDSDAEESLDSINDLFDERATEIMKVLLDHFKNYRDFT